MIVARHLERDNVLTLVTRDVIRDSSHHTQHGAPACERGQWSLGQLLQWRLLQLSSGADHTGDPGDQELGHHVQPHVLHLHQVPEGHGLQGGPEEVSLA